MLENTRQFNPGETMTRVEFLNKLNTVISNVEHVEAAVRWGYDEDYAADLLQIRRDLDAAWPALLDLITDDYSQIGTVTRAQ